MTSDPREMIAAYFECSLNVDQVAELEAWLSEDRDRLRLLVREAMLDNHLGELLHEANLQEVTADLSDDSQFGALLESFGNRPVPYEEEPAPIHIDSSTPLTRQAYASALSYVYEHTFTRKRVAIMAAAAALLLGVVLTIVFLPSDDGTQDVAQLPDPPDYMSFTPRPDPNRVVATITDQTQAVWVSTNGQGALPDRTLLGPNQRLTLAEGFAQITTNHGAKVLVKAPATIETTASDNALRLHRGKLVGRCETPSSKGFIVHAPGMDVIDLGTVFGVEADPAGGSTVIVMEGSVRAEPAFESPQAFEPVVLQRNEARRVVPETGSLKPLAIAEAPAFHSETPHPYVLAVMDAAPVAYWRFEDDAGRTVANEIGHGGDALKMVGPARLTEQGAIGKAGRLDNRRRPYAYFETDEPIEAMAGLDEYTIELWYYTNERYEMERENSTASIFNLYDPYQDDDQESATEAWMLSIELGNDFWVDKPDDFILERPPGWREFAIRGFPMKDLGTGERREVYTAQHYPIGRWQHLVFVKKKDSVTLYLDGTPAETELYTPPIINPASVRLGRSVLDVIQEFDPDNPYSKGLYRALRGRLDEVALYDKALSAEEIAKHHALATEGGDPP